MIMSIYTRHFVEFCLQPMQAQVHTYMYDMGRCLLTKNTSIHSVFYPQNNQWKHAMIFNIVSAIA